MTAFEKVLLVDDHPLVRAGCRQVLRAMRATVLEATTAMAALHINRDEQPDLILLDINLPDMNGADALDRLRAENPRARVIMLTMYEDIALARRLLKRGAAAYVTKNDSPALLLRAIEGVLHGYAFISPRLEPQAENANDLDSSIAGLSPRDRRIIDLLGEGKSLAEISYELGRSYKTVANVTNMIRSRLGLRTNAALIRFAVERRLAPRSEP